MNMRMLIAAIAAIAVFGVATPAMADGPGNREVDVIVYVTSQGLYYDSIVTADPLPQRGRFQKLEMVDGGLQTTYGPGDPGYIGGRWWVDVNGDGIQNSGDHFFLCPLLGPGRTAP